MTDTTERFRADLRRPEAYDFPVTDVELRETHISLVFLTEDDVYKVEKPVSLGFLDFSTLELREHYCQEELRLNQRLAPWVYVEVVPVRRDAAGRLTFRASEGGGEVVDYAVHMRRLPDDRELGHVLARRPDNAGEIIDDTARRLASFHRTAQRDDATAARGRHEIVAENALDNFRHSRSLRGDVVEESVWDRAQALTEAALAEHHDLIEARAAAGIPCDTHGDLRLDHIYVLDGKDPVIIDCIEFSENFRYSDPIADLAFLAMDLHFEGWHHWARRLVASYRAASAESREERAAFDRLLPLYVAYRAAVRGKVEAIRRDQLTDPEERATAERKARAYFSLILDQLEKPAQRPCLFLTCGLPASGKSSLARALGGPVFRTDVVRNELFPPSDAGQDGYGEGRYEPDSVDRVYEECARRAVAELAKGGRATVDATFQKERHRLAMIHAARVYAAPVVIFECHLPREEALARLAARTGDASEADATTYEKMAAEWESFGPESEVCRVRIDTSGTPEETLALATQQLVALGLISSALHLA